MTKKAMFKEAYWSWVAALTNERLSLPKSGNRRHWHVKEAYVKDAGWPRNG